MKVESQASQEQARMTTTSMVASAKGQMMRRDKSEVQLPDGYEPDPFDVICKRDRESILHVGNNRFRLCVDMRVDSYLAAKSRTDKSLIIQEIIDAVHNCGGRFIRQDDVVASSHDKLDCSVFGRKLQDTYKTSKRPMYFDIGTKKAADKVGHAMRLTIAARESSTTNNSRRQSWPAPTICSSAVIKKAKRRNSTCHETMRWEKPAIKGPGNVPIPSVLSLDQYDAMLAGLVDSNTWNPIANDISTSSGINCIPMRDATTMSNRSWHAGGFIREDENCHVATSMLQRGSILCPSDVSLSSKGWDLDDFPAEDDDEYSTVFGNSSLSLDDCHTFKNQDLSLMNEPPRVISVSPVLVSQAVDFDDDHDFSWSDYFFDNGGDSP